MENGINRNVKEDYYSMVNSKGFKDSNEDIQKRILELLEDDKKLKIGIMGRILGTDNESKKDHMIMFAIIVLSFMVFIDMAYSFLYLHSSSPEFSKFVLLPMLTGAFGYEGGKGRHKSS